MMQVVSLLAVIKKQLCIATFQQWCLPRDWRTAVAQKWLMFESEEIQ